MTLNIISPSNRIKQAKKAPEQILIEKHPLYAL